MKMWCMYVCVYACMSVYIYYTAIKKDEVVPFAKTWMDPRGIMLSETGPNEKDTYKRISLICGM